MKFNAAIHVASREPLVIDEVKLVRLGPNDVLVRVQAAGLCHTDWEAQQGNFATATPIILGHECAGVVEEVGSQVKAVKAGQKVACSVYPACGHCYYCRRQQPMLCEPVLASHKKGRLLDGLPRIEWNGQPLQQFMNVAAFAEYVIIPEYGAVPIPEEIPADRACILGCAVITGIGAVTRVAKVEYGASVAIIGCGPVGLNVVQGAKRVGASVVCAVDTSAERLEQARAMGATHCVNASSENLSEILADLTNGRNADYVFEAAGSEQAFQEALDATRVGGTLVLLGKVDPTSKVSLRFGSMMGDKRIIRSSLGGSCAHDDFSQYAHDYLHGTLELDSMITERMPLAEINTGLEKLARGELIRGVLVF
ncbi:zinc-binding dehydrogenase [Pollutimonas thiosulfatoxidans]|uniref:Enoyl reductase (ER) domain-containing protein n=1 Tax=Pollutimonas thiosulfatoxidans TaxID=2028345 RepID=A0A410GE49_9BURK|nr:zinc-binding dehydrogenase [Pollutimonas thiosulfatoxidans]QAA94572.1 hypothetical protein CKA81_12580 [Pollutimonas thiosulfatoxidans]